MSSLKITDRASNFFTKEDLLNIEKICLQYPPDRKMSCVLSFLHIAQRRNGNWISDSVIEIVSEVFSVRPIKIREIVSFYSMFRLFPVGKYHFQICGTTACSLNAVNDIICFCRKEIAEEKTRSADKLFSWEIVECLGLCHFAPVVHINEDILYNVSLEQFEQFVFSLRKGKDVNLVKSVFSRPKSIFTVQDWSVKNPYYFKNIPHKDV